MLDLSIVIVNYNSAEYLRECTNSIRRQVLSDKAENKLNWEIIVIDNASSDKDKKILEGLSGENLKVVFNVKNIGFAAANNQAVTLSQAEYLLFLNPDTLLLDNCLEKMIVYLRKNPQITFAGPLFWLDREKTFFVGPNNLPRVKRVIYDYLALKGWRIKNKKISFPETSGESPQARAMLSGAAFIISRRDFDEIGGWDENFFLYYEDSDLFQRAQNKGLKAVCLPAAEVVHYWRQSSRFNRKEVFSYQKDSFKYYFKKYLNPLVYPAFMLIIKCIDLLPFYYDQKFKKIKTQNPPEIDIMALAGGRRLDSCLAYLEFSSGPSFGQSGIAIIDQPYFQFPAGFWEKLLPGEYFLRLNLVKSGASIIQSRPIIIEKIKKANF